MQRTELINTAIKASIAAGKKILEVYNSNDFQIVSKEDKSPLTLADKNAHLKIMEYLEETGIPILSEEGKSVNYDERKNRNVFWLVDPLDGTKEFIKKNGEFTVNIALIENNYATLGVIYVPVTGELYFADTETGAYKINNISDDNLDYKDYAGKSEKLPLRAEKRKFTVVSSRSHISEDTQNFINKCKEKHDEIEIISKGSSLKLCMIAEGKADIYPRFGPTMEWDTAAGHAIVTASGANVYRADNKTELRYNKESLLNPYFIVE